MSGIVGIVNWDGAPVNAKLLRDLTDGLSFRGPDAQEIWTSGNVGFGHAMLRTAEDPGDERQPCTIDSRVWITADVRLDDRPALIRKLHRHIRGDLERATDPELILHGYSVWGEECSAHLIGDFAFAIWDEPKRRLFCARDALGVKPFFYARLGATFLLGNTFDTFRSHPDVSNRLNEAAVGDFLLFGLNLDAHTTTFLADIRPLPPGHSLLCTAETFDLKRYWSPPLVEELRYRRSSDYVEHFRELLDTAVSDRLRSSRVGVFMSGGIDSTLIAAAARRVLSRRAPEFDLRAHTVVYDRLIPDQERRYSGLAAEALGIPIHYVIADDYGLDEWWTKTGVRAGQPPNPSPSLGIVLNRQAAAHSRTALTGWDGDGVLNVSLKSYLTSLVRSRAFGPLLRALTNVAGVAGLHLKLHRSVARRRSTQEVFSAAPGYPVWLNEEFARRLDLPHRWQEARKSRLSPAMAASPRAYTYAFLATPLLPLMFEGHDPGVSRTQLEIRHPLLDLRIIHYLLRLPPVPWSINKTLFRWSMKGDLPNSVRLRPKTPLAGDPLQVLLSRPTSPVGLAWDPAPELSQYVNVDAVPKLTAGDQSFSVQWMNLRPLSLDMYLQRLP